MLSQERFWVVLGKDNRTARYTTREEAKQEAIRLATQENRTFYVMELVGFAEPRQAVWETLSMTKLAKEA